MPLTLTTLNNDAAVAKTFTEISKDKVSAEWINATDSSATKDVRFNVKQSLLGKNKAGVSIRRSLVQTRVVVPTATAGVTEEATVNLTITRPVTSTALTSTDVRDIAAYIKNFLSTGSNIDALGQGQV